MTKDEFKANGVLLDIMLKTKDEVLAANLQMLLAQVSRYEKALNQIADTAKGMPYLCAKWALTGKDFI